MQFEQKLKYSKYIAITDYVDRQHRLVCSFLTGKVLLINDNIHKKILENNTDIQEDARQKFVEAEILVDADLNELEKVIEENMHSIENRNTFSFTVFPSANCQMGCHYCGQHHTKGKVEKDLYKDILAHVSKGVSGAEKRHLAIGWFGGEALLGMNIIEYLTPEFKRIAERNACSYSARITTNGLLLNREYFRKLIDCDVRDITISLDGTGKSHDQRRPTKGGGPTFNVILNNLIDIFSHYNVVKEQVDIMLRINVDQHNYHDIIPLLEVLAKLNFQDKIKSFDISPIHAWGNDAHLRSLNIQEFADFKIDCYIKLLELGFLETMPIPGRSRAMCQAVTPDSLYMQTDGSLFDCSELPLVPVEEKTKKLGHIGSVDSIRVMDRHYASWNQEILEHKYPCTDCRILPICAGACPKSWKSGHVPCPDYKYHIEDLISLAYISASRKNLFETEAVL